MNDAYIREARLRYQAMQKEHISLKDNLRYRIKELYYSFDKAKRSVVLYRDSLLALARDALKVTESDYRGGKIDFLNVLDAQEILLNYQVDYERSVKEQNQTVATIEKTVGFFFENYQNQRN
jgi:outer membrane protein TolC